jgi:hypothetical protein
MSHPECQCPLRIVGLRRILDDVVEAIRHHEMRAGTGGISGTVVDSSGRLIPGASIKVLSTATGITLQTTTTGSGVYSFPSLPPASYQSHRHQRGV